MLRNFFKKQPSNNTPDLTNADNALNYLLTDGFCAMDWKQKARLRERTSTAPNGK